MHPIPLLECRERKERILGEASCAQSAQTIIMFIGTSEGAIITDVTTGRIEGTSGARGTHSLAITLGDVSLTVVTWNTESDTHDLRMHTRPFTD